VSLAAAVRSAVEAARVSTLSLQVDVVHTACVGQDALGAPEYDEYPVTRKALVQEGAVHHETEDGQVITTKAKLYFLQAIAPHGAEGRQEPIDPRDLFTLPSGLIGKSLEIPGAAVNPETDLPYVRAAWLV
jgi:hypothetical protein